MDTQTRCKAAYTLDGHVGERAFVEARPLASEPTKTGDAARYFFFAFAALGLSLLGSSASASSSARLVDSHEKVFSVRPK